MSAERMPRSVNAGLTFPFYHICTAGFFEYNAQASAEMLKRNIFRDSSTVEQLAVVRA
jgi:hypothetical protein